MSEGHSSPVLASGTRQKTACSTSALARGVLAGTKYLRLLAGDLSFAAGTEGSHGSDDGPGGTACCFPSGGPHAHSATATSSPRCRRPPHCLRSSSDPDALPRRPPGPQRLRPSRCLWRCLRAGWRAVGAASLGGAYGRLSMPWRPVVRQQRKLSDGIHCQQVLAGLWDALPKDTSRGWRRPTAEALPPRAAAGIAKIALPLYHVDTRIHTHTHNCTHRNPTMLACAQPSEPRRTYAPNYSLLSRLLATQFPPPSPPVVSPSPILLP